MNDKLVLRQVAPEYQGEWLIEDLKAMEGFIVIPNRNYIGMVNMETHGLMDDNFGTETLDFMIQEYGDFIDGEETWYGPYENTKELICDNLSMELSDEQVTKIEKAINEYYDYDDKKKLTIEEELFAGILGAIDGKTYEVEGIRGCSQGDFAALIYDPELVDPQLVESYYFNTGTEWEIGHVEYEDDEEVDFETVELDFGFHYTLEWSDDRIRKEFADCYHIDEEDVVILGYDGYIKVPRYKIV